MMRTIFRRPLLVLLALLASAAGAKAQNNVVLVAIEQSPTAWADSRLYDKLAERLTRDSKVRVSQISPKIISPNGNSSGVFDFDDLLAAGRTAGGQYILLIQINSERYDRRKTFTVPLIFHKWEVIGVIEGEWRLIDVVKGRQIKAAPFKIEMNGKRIFQATMDDNVDDPDINMTSSAKLLFFGQLEDLLADQIFTVSQIYLGKQDREYVTRSIEKK